MFRMLVTVVMENILTIFIKNAPFVKTIVFPAKMGSATSVTRIIRL